MMNLKAYREAKKMTQEELAEKAGVGRTQIANIENGTSLPSVKTAQLIGKILDFDWIIFFEK